MIAASLSATRSGTSATTSSVVPSSTPTPSTEAIAKQLGVDPASEEYLMHLVSEMRSAPLPPTWTAVESTTTATTTTTTTEAENMPSTQSLPRGHVNAPAISLSSSSSLPSTSVSSASIEYVNRLTEERTSRHPGTSYFMAAVESERNRQKGCAAGALPPPGTEGLVGSLLLHQQQSTGWLRQSTGSLRQSTQHHGHVTTNDHDHTGSSTISSMNSIVGSKSMNDIMGRGTDWDIHSSTSDAQTHRSTTIAEDQTAVENKIKGEVESPTRSKRAATKRRAGKRCRRGTQAPKWLNFTSWWYETTSGSLNSMDRKHASIRYGTDTDTFEVELQDVPVIFQVSHATARHGRVGTIDLHVGAQISILGRQMRLMQCDGQTAQWLESETREMSKAKAALISALEREGDCVRVRCRSDRLEASVSAMRGGGSVGSAASINRRCLMQDVIALRDTLADTQPDEARRLTEGLL